MPEQINEEIIEIDKGSVSQNKKTNKLNKDWNEMSNAMQDFVDIFFLEASIFKTKEPLKMLTDYIQNYDRLLYTLVSDNIYDKFSKENEKNMVLQETFLFNIDQLIEDYEDKKGQISLEINVKMILFKFKDHANLAIRQYRSLKQTDEEYEKKFMKKIAPVKEQVRKDITTQLISLVSVFTAMTFVIFGGINSLQATFNAAESQNIIRVLLISVIWGISMFNVIYGFLFCISKMTSLEIQNKTENNICGKYPLFFWINTTLIFLLTSSIWLLFLQRIGLFSGVPWESYKYRIALIGTAILLFLIVYMYKKLYSLTSNKNN